MVSRRSDSDLSKAQLYYDSSTGQVYTEAVVSAKTGKNRGWSLPRLKRVREKTGGYGAPSLERLALQTVLDNVYSLSPETIENAPWTVKRRIWETCEHSDDISHDAKFHLWKTVIESQPPHASSDPTIAYRRMCKEETVHEHLQALPVYTKAINSPTSSWLTALTLSQINFPRRDIYDLSTLHNLVALDICAAPDSAPSDPFAKDPDVVRQALIDNTVLRYLANHAEVAPAFQSLRVLILRGFRDVTSDCLHYLIKFPRLSLFGVQNCGIGANASSLRVDEHRAIACGWTTEDERGLLGQLKHEIEMSHTWDGMLRACVEMTADFSTAIRATNTLERAKSAEVTATPRADGALRGGWRAEVRRQDAKRRLRCRRKDECNREDAVGEEQILTRARPDPPLLNFKIGPTCSDLIFSTPMVFFRCMHGHIQEEEKTSTNNSAKARQVQRSGSKGRRPSGPGDARAAKRPKLRAGRAVQLTELCEMQGVGRRLSGIELENR